MAHTILFIEAGGQNITWYENKKITETKRIELIRAAEFSQLAINQYSSCIVRLRHHEIVKAKRGKPTITNNSITRQAPTSNIRLHQNIHSKAADSRSVLMMKRFSLATPQVVHGRSTSSRSRRVQRLRFFFPCSGPQPMTHTLRLTPSLLCPPLQFISSLFPGPGSPGFGGGNGSCCC